MTRVASVGPKVKALAAKVPPDLALFALMLGCLAAMAWMGARRWGLYEGWMLAAVSFTVALVGASWLLLLSLQRTQLLLMQFQARHVEAFVRFANGRGDGDPKAWAKDRRQR